MNDTPPELPSIRVAVADLNGQARGKRLRSTAMNKLAAEGIRFPYSVLGLDIRGEDIQDSPLVFASGDPDGLLKPTGRGPVPMPWLSSGAVLVPIWMFHADGVTPYAADPRQALAAVLARYAGRGWTPVTATELEFYLVDDSGKGPQVPASPGSATRRHQADILSLRELDAFDAFFTELYAGCAAMDIPADTASSEAGPGQFEVTLTHQPDALKTADDTWLFKILAQGLARKHGCAACFMAKPYPDYAGNGLHCHFSVLDAAGGNIFDDGSAGGSPRLHHAVAGSMAAMAGTMVIFAPHATSYDRFVPGAHAPTAAAWGYENRTTALRIPGGPPVARRIEHRVAGGDSNPYLFLVAVLGAAFAGLEEGHPPPPPLQGNAYDQNLPRLPTTWPDAIARFGADPVTARLFAPGLIDAFTRTKRQELHKTRGLGAAELFALYVDTV
ncbi:MAG: glutamine synthetase [Rhodobacteraceae bacterium]|nr:glutamine synthetase [Paracoccaceae bacterium]